MDNLSRFSGHPSVHPTLFSNETRSGREDSAPNGAGWIRALKSDSSITKSHGTCSQLFPRRSGFPALPRSPDPPRRAQRAPGAIPASPRCFSSSTSQHPVACQARGLPAPRWPGGGIHPARKTTGMALAAPRPQHVRGLFAEPGRGPGAHPAWIYTPGQGSRSGTLIPREALGGSSVSRSERWGSQGIFPGERELPALGSVVPAGFPSPRDSVIP